MTRVYNYNTADMASKVCSECGVEKPLNTDHWHRNRTKKNGFAVYCKQCMKRRNDRAMRDERDLVTSRHRKNQAVSRFKYALTRSRKYAQHGGFAPCCASEDTIASAYTGYCAICGVPEIECKARLCMDHDHQTGAFRGWLCARCNTLLGRVHDSVDILESAYNYLCLHSAIQEDNNRESDHE